MTTTTTPRPTVADGQKKILLDLLDVAGWVAGDDGMAWRHPDGTACLVATEDQDGNPVYVVGWSDDDTPDDAGTVHTISARKALDVLVAVGLLPDPGPLLAADVAARASMHLSQKAAREGKKLPGPIKDVTVCDWAYRARHGLRGAGSNPHPFPLPEFIGVPDRARPFWHVMDWPVIEAWLQGRPGKGVGGGRPRKVVAGAKP